MYILDPCTHLVDMQREFSRYKLEMINGMEVSSPAISFRRSYVNCHMSA